MAENSDNGRFKLNDIIQTPAGQIESYIDYSLEILKNVKFSKSPKRAVLQGAAVEMAKRRLTEFQEGPLHKVRQVFEK